MPLPVYRGKFHPWECDELGHINVRFYADRLVQAVAVFAGEIGLPAAWSVSLERVVTVYQRELLGGDGIFMDALLPEAGLKDLTAEPLRLPVWFLLRRSRDGALCASFQGQLTLFDEQREPQSWSHLNLETREDLLGTPPAEALPRSLVLNTNLSAGSHREAEQRALQPHYLAPAHAPSPGASLAPATLVTSVIADGMDQALAPLVHAIPRPVGTAILEASFLGADPVEPGTPLAVYGQVAEIKRKTATLDHWVVDRRSGKGLAASQTVIGLLDLEARSLIALDKDLADQLVACFSDAKISQ